MNYIALTIGPIYKTLQNAQKTRQMWGGSYFFSYVMKQIIKKVLDNDTDVEFVTPYVDSNKLNETNGVGLFHDRMIFKSNSIEKNRLQEIVDEVLQDIETESKKQIDFNFLKNYLQIHIVELAKDKIKNPILDISPYLDTQELFYQAQTSNKNTLLDYIKNRLQGSFLAKDAFGNSKASFPSLPEIALYELLDKTDIKDYLKHKLDDELSVYEEKTYKDKIKNYHKYIAIIQADGDNMGKVLKDIGENSTKLKEFSKALFDFCLDATKKVEEFGGKMIYAGGDDLFFFAPTVSCGKTIFKLCDEIDDIFRDKINSLKLNQKPTLSFGVNISYYKYPLYEAKDNAGYLLFARAKDKRRNNIAYRVTKHSGQFFEDVVHKEDNDYLHFLDLINIALKESDDENFLHSLHHKIRTYENVLEEIKDDKERLENFFDNYFNEDEHKKYKEFFEKIIDFIYTSKDLNRVYSALRFVKFVKGDK